MTHGNILPSEQNIHDALAAYTYRQNLHVAKSFTNSVLITASLATPAISAM